VQLKALIQLLAASVAGRPSMHYLTFGDEALADDLRGVVSRLRAANCSIGQLATLLRKFKASEWPHAPPLRGQPGYHANLFGYINKRLDRYHAKVAERRAVGVAAAEAEAEAQAQAQAAEAEAAEAEAAQAADGDRTEEDEPCGAIAIWSAP